MALGKAAFPCSSCTKKPLFFFRDGEKKVSGPPREAHWMSNKELCYLCIELTDRET